MLVVNLVPRAFALWKIGNPWEQAFGWIFLVVAVFLINRAYVIYTPL